MHRAPISELSAQATAPSNDRRMIGEICSYEVMPLIHIRFRVTCIMGDKLTITAKRYSGGQVRATSATWDDAVVIYPGAGAIPGRPISGR